jgi:transcription elongation factor Elf1
VPNTNNPLPIKCPRCDHNGGRLVVKSITVMTVKCASCAHFWATDLRSLSPEIQEKVHAMLREL